MDALLPTEVFALEVQPGETVPVIDAPASFRITMAAIDPTAPAIPDPDRPDAPPRATLKMIRHYEPLEFDDDEDDLSDEDIDDEDVAAIERKLGLELENNSEDDSEDEAGPSDPAKSKKARVAAVMKLLANGDDEDVDMDELPNGVNGVKKGKAKVADEDDDEEDSDDELDEDDVELPLCTLDTTHHYQQALDLTVMDPSSVSFKVIGTHSIFLTGNFVEIPEDDSEGDSEDDEEDEYGNALDSLVAPYGEEDDEEDDEEIDSEEDELDYLEDPRIEEVDTDEEEAAPKLIKAKAAVTKGKNKRPAESEDEEADDLDKLISKTLKSADAAQTNGEQKLSKKQLKKLKKNDGQAAAAAAAPAKDEVEKKSAVKDSPANGKKVQFAKELEQGPTPTKADAAPNAKKEAKSQNKGVKVVQGVSIDERKEGQGPGVKKGDRVGMRYIGKLEKDGKVFDSNKKGKPFSFKLGTGEVIKGWDVGLQGMKVGGERRITIPPSMAYGSQKLPDIPPNSTLVFDVKCLTIN